MNLGSLSRQRSSPCFALVGFCKIAGAHAQITKFARCWLPHDVNKKVCVEKDIGRMFLDDPLLYAQTPKVIGQSP